MMNATVERMVCAHHEIQLTCRSRSGCLAFTGGQGQVDYIERAESGPTNRPTEERTDVTGIFSPMGLRKGSVGR